MAGFKGWKENSWFKDEIFDYEAYKAEQAEKWKFNYSSYGTDQLPVFTQTQTKFITKIQAFKFGDIQTQVLSIPNIRTIPNSDIAAAAKTRATVANNTELLRWESHYASQQIPVTEVLDEINLIRAHAKALLFKNLVRSIPSRKKFIDEISGDLDIIALRETGERFFEERRLANSDKSISIYNTVSHSWGTSSASIARGNAIFLGFKDALTALNFKIHGLNVFQVYNTTPTPGAKMPAVYFMEPVIAGNLASTRELDWGSPAYYRTYGFKMLGVATSCSGLGMAPPKTDHMIALDRAAIVEHAQGKKTVCLIQTAYDKQSSAISAINSLAAKFKTLVVNKDIRTLTISP